MPTIGFWKGDKALAVSLSNSKLSLSFFNFLSSKVLSRLTPCEPARIQSLLYYRCLLQMKLSQKDRSLPKHYDQNRNVPGYKIFI